MPRFSKLGYVALDVSDLARARRHYEELVGLTVSGPGDGGELFLRCSDDHHNIVLHPASQPGLRRIGWEMESEQELENAVKAVSDSGLAVRELEPGACDALHQGPTFRFFEPHTGATIELYAVMRNLGGKPYEPTVAKIQRLGHVVVATPAFDAAFDFFTKVLDFKLSDAVGNAFALMRCFPNPYHHSFGLARADRRALHHVNFMVSEIDDVGRGMWRFQRNEVPLIYGPGRHPASGSVFLYFLDPDGLGNEYSYGMEQFPEENPRRPRVLEPAPESADSWGAPPPRFNLVETTARDEGV